MSFLSTQRRPGTSTPGDGSRTATITDAPPQEADGPANQPIGSLRLRGAPRRNRPRVAWDDDVVDNEGCGRKSSKICCIYHKPRNFDESSSDESDSDSDSDSDWDARNRARRANHNHDHPHPHPGPSPEGGAASAQRDPQAPAVVSQLDDAASERNAYEIVPSAKKGKGKRKANV
ncbi:phosphatase inhibitor-domain-containing protein, partial [Mycena rebaudengoi]